MSGQAVASEDLNELVECSRRANAAFMRGDIDGYLALVTHADDYTLMAPFGGPPTFGFDRTSERLEAMARFFRNGRTELELVRTYASGNLAVLVLIERQRAEVGGLPEQDWSLRVTLVFRREGTGWSLVHRHADPLVHGMSLEQTAAIARGQTPAPLPTSGSQ